MTVDSQNVTIGRTALSCRWFQGYGLGFAVLVVVALVGAAGFQWRTRLPSDRQVRTVFDERRASFDRAAAMLQNAQCAGIIASDGSAGNATCSIPIETRRVLMQQTGAKSIVLRGDGSSEFVLWGTGCTICSDSYKGLRYSAANPKSDQLREWVPVVARSLETNDLPKTNGTVSEGLYVVPIDGRWSIFRFEYNE